MYCYGNKNKTMITKVCTCFCIMVFKCDIWNVIFITHRHDYINIIEAITISTKSTSSSFLLGYFLVVDIYEYIDSTIYLYSIYLYSVIFHSWHLVQTKRTEKSHHAWVMDPLPTVSLPACEWKCCSVLIMVSCVESKSRCSISRRCVDAAVNWWRCSF